MEMLLIAIVVLSLINAVLCAFEIVSKFRDAPLHALAHEVVVTNFDDE